MEHAITLRPIDLRILAELRRPDFAAEALRGAVDALRRHWPTIAPDLAFRIANIAYDATVAAVRIAPWMFDTASIHWALADYAVELALDCAIIDHLEFPYRHADPGAPWLT